MKCMNIVIGTKGKDGKTFWHNIGTVFCSDDSVLQGENGKPATFVIDYPATNGIIAERTKKKETNS